MEITVIGAQRSIGQSGLEAALRRRSVAMVALEPQIHLRMPDPMSESSPIATFVPDEAESLLQEQDKLVSFPEADTELGFSVMLDAARH